VLGCHTPSGSSGYSLRLVTKVTPVTAGRLTRTLRNRTGQRPTDEAMPARSTTQWAENLESIREAVA